MDIKGLLFSPDTSNDYFELLEEFGIDTKDEDEWAQDMNEHGFTAEDLLDLWAVELTIAENPDIPEDRASNLVKRMTALFKIGYRLGEQSVRE